MTYDELEVAYFAEREKNLKLEATNNSLHLDISMAEEHVSHLEKQVKAKDAVIKCLEDKDKENAQALLKASADKYASRMTDGAHRILSAIEPSRGPMKQISMPAANSGRIILETTDTLGLYSGKDRYGVSQYHAYAKIGGEIIRYSNNSMMHLSSSELFSKVLDQMISELRLATTERYHYHQKNVAN